jgi:hypothetical protein
VGSLDTRNCPRAISLAPGKASIGSSKNVVSWRCRAHVLRAASRINPQARLRFAVTDKITRRPLLRTLPRSSQCKVVAAAPTAVSDLNSLGERITVTHPSSTLQASASSLDITVRHSVRRCAQRPGCTARGNAGGAKAVIIPKQRPSSRPADQEGRGQRSGGGPASASQRAKPSSQHAGSLQNCAAGQSCESNTGDTDFRRVRRFFPLVRRCYASAASCLRSSRVWEALRSGYAAAFCHERYVSRPGRAAPRLVVSEIRAWPSASSAPGAQRAPRAAPGEEEWALERP